MDMWEVGNWTRGCRDEGAGVGEGGEGGEGQRLEGGLVGAGALLQQLLHAWLAGGWDGGWPGRWSSD